MTNKTSAPTGKGLARRRLLRGTFAAPAVLTLFSGSAFAAKSATCLAKRVSSPVNAGLNPSGTVWIRVQVWKSTDGTNFANFVSGNDLAGLLAPGGSYLASGNWQCVLSGVVSTVSYTVPNTYYNPSPAPAVTGQYVAVRVDATGKILGVEGIEAGGSAMTTSCWTSVGGLNPFKL